MHELMIIWLSPCSTLPLSCPEGAKLRTFITPGNQEQEKLLDTGSGRQIDQSVNMSGFDVLQKAQRLKK